MKNKFWLLGIIVLVAVIGFTVTACKDNDDGGDFIEMVWIKAGTFTMGSPADEKSRSQIENMELQHQVALINGFYMGKYLVSRGQWKAVM